MLIMTLVTKSLSSVSAGVTRVAATGFAPIVYLVKAFVHRREILRLAELDERGLKDIGLVRSDIEGALATSWLKDPSTVLASRSQSVADVAAARRETGVRQAPVDAPIVKVRRDIVAIDNSIACSA
ncbi:DUF1127 domain-containing protein [Bosea lathyri]|uniref:YjiS-like domain-containing protein n=1 Tax=Bosea lathyri TaxID=1036778 RepID=A0A1H5T7R2_9HYPH|nr:DUF1127 domain-containing protein [Bosea lathyri]SEF58829.1 protein of unknown function [Bosea lathyri]